jgi:hypothetical protein
MFTFHEAAGALPFSGVTPAFLEPIDYFEAIACAFALLTASRKECADAGIVTSPLSIRAFETLWP